MTQAFENDNSVKNAEAGVAPVMNMSREAQELLRNTLPAKTELSNVSTHVPDMTLTTGRDKQDRSGILPPEKVQNVLDLFRRLDAKVGAVSESRERRSRDPNAPREQVQPSTPSDDSPRPGAEAKRK